MREESIALYGTVYNNSNRVRESIHSIEKALLYTGVRTSVNIVDNFSDDGTYEELLKLSVEYGNINIVRKKCNRGDGRNSALDLCPSGSMVTYVDLDSVYNEYFAILLSHGIDFVKNGMLVIAQKFIYGNRDKFIDIGGWKSLNHGEDAEFFVRATRTTPCVAIPVMVCEDETVKGERERRYAKGMNFYLRKLRCDIDRVRGLGMDFRQTLSYYGNGNNVPSSLLKKTASICIYVYAWMRGIYCYGDVYNIELYNRLFLERLLLPNEIGMPKTTPLVFAISIKDEMIRRLQSKGITYSYGEMGKQYVVTATPTEPDVS
ncbi:MAG: glycosyltransferase family 2 protein [Candidatus Thermoplasmatota archaeon]|nr:glycosyltransferase family 2 protein [Candidatus Thermoplasmatota archaeon]